MMASMSTKLLAVSLFALFSSAWAFGCDDSEAGGSSGTETETDTGTEQVTCPAKEVLQGGTLFGDGVVHDEEALADDEVWKAEDSPHVVTQWLLVENGRTLTIEPCAVVQLEDGAGIEVGSGWGAGSSSNAGDLVAVGTADEPILFAGSRQGPGAWARLQFNRTSGQSALAHVTVEGAGQVLNSEEAGTLILAGAGAGPDSILSLNDVTLRGGAGDGLALEGGAELETSSKNLTVTGMSRHPVRAEAVSARSLPGGDYEGNGDDRVLLYGAGAVVPADVGEVNWRNLGIPYVYDIGTYQNWHTRLTVESGVKVYVKNDTDPDSGTEDNGIIGFGNGGAITAEGGNEEGKIAFEGEDGRHWAGFFFYYDCCSGLPKEPAVSVFDHVRVVHAGTHNSCNGDHFCTDLLDCTTAIKLEGPYLEMTNTEVVGISNTMYAIAREYCGDGDEGFAAAELNNTFTGPMHCPQTDQNECDPVGGACFEETTCCQHNYVCHGDIL